MNRFEIAKALNQQASEKTAQIMQEVLKLKPIGRLSDFQQACRVKPKQGVTLSTPIGTYCFGLTRTPKPDQVEFWNALQAEAQKCLKEAARLATGIVIDDCCTIGNRKFLENVLQLQTEGLTDGQKNAFIVRLQNFWNTNPNAKSGIVNGETIEVLS